MPTFAAPDGGGRPVGPGGGHPRGTVGGVLVSGDHLSAVYDPRFAAELVSFLDEVRASA